MSFGFHKCRNLLASIYWKISSMMSSRVWLKPVTFQVNYVLGFFLGGGRRSLQGGLKPVTRPCSTGRNDRSEY